MTLYPASTFLNIGIHVVPRREKESHRGQGKPDALGFASVIILAFMPTALWWLLRRVSKRSRNARQKLADSVNTIEQITAGINVIQAMGAADGNDGFLLMVSSYLTEQVHPVPAGK